MLFRFAILTALLAFALPAAEVDALAIDSNLRVRHMPFRTLLDPIFSSSSSNNITGYTRCGDSALWTGAYLAAESFRYKVSPTFDALQNVKTTLAGIRDLVGVTFDDRLARCIVPDNSPYQPGIVKEESQNTSYHGGAQFTWIDNTSRDQVVGVFFGLGVAYDLVDDAAVRSSVSDLATRLLTYISHHQWSPNNDIKSTFELRPEELQMLLQVVRHVNPSASIGGPLINLPVQTAVSVDTLSNSSYFKFNLDYMSFFHLLPLQNNDANRSAYRIVRSYTATHQNAFFNVVDRALSGPDPLRDKETADLLDQWLARPRRDFAVNLSTVVRVCGSEACLPIPVRLRVPTDFLWQRSPFQLSGGGTGTIEGAGVDYLLPYWMARYYGVIPGSIQPAAAPGLSVAPSSIASWFGADLAATTAVSTQQPPPQTLGGVTLTVTDSLGVSRPALLTYVSPGQINFVVPDGTSIGVATFTTGHQTANGTVASVAPALFSMNGAGSGVAAATAIATIAGNPGSQSPLPVFQCGSAGCTSVPITLGIDTPIYVTLYATGVRNRSSLQAVHVTINRVSVPVLFAGPSPEFAGLDQVNIALTLDLRGAGESKVVLTVDGQASNAVTINVR